MNFFDELLNSYSLLKKRKLRVSLNEQSPGEINVDIFRKKLASGEESAIKADQQAEVMLQSVLPGYPGNGCVATIGNLDYPTVSQVEGGYAYQNEAGKMVKFASEGGEDCKYKINASKVPGLKNHIAVGIYPTLLGQEAAADGLNPEAGLAMGGPVTDLANEIEDEIGVGVAPILAKMIGALWGAGDNLLSKIQPLLDTFPALGDYLKNGPGSPKGRQQIIAAWFNPDNATSIFGVAKATLENKEAVGAVLSELVSDSIENVTPSKQDIATYFSKLETMLGILRKPWGDITSEEKEFMSDNIRVLSVEKKAGRKRDRGVRDTVFIKVNEDNDLGISLDGAAGNKQSGLAILLQDYQEKLNAAQEEQYSVTTKELKEAIRSADNFSTKVVTDLSEDMDTMLTYVQQKKPKEAMKVFRNLWDNHKDLLLQAANIVKAAEDGEIAYDSNILGIQEMLDEFGSTEDEAKRAFMQIVSNVGARRARLLAQLKPSAVLRVGDRPGAGTEGFKADQFYIWNKSDYEASQDSIKKYKGTIKEYTSEEDMKKDRFTDKEIKAIKERVGDISDGVYLNPISMKWTYAEDRITLGGQPGPANVVNDFVNRMTSKKPSAIYTRMMAEGALATTPEEQAGILEAAQELQGYMGMLDQIKKGNTLMGAAQGAAEFEAAIGMPLDQASEGDVAFGFLKNRTPGEDLEAEKKYRQLAVMFIARGAWDKDNATDHYEFTTSDKTYLDNRNDLLNARTRGYIENGEGGKITKSSINVRGVKYKTYVSNKNTGTIRGETEVLASAIRDHNEEPKEPVNDSTNPEEMYKFFQKLYEALTSIE